MDWRQAEGFPLYFVSEFGDVVSIRMNKRLKGFMDYDGYPAYNLEDFAGVKRQIAAHRAVAMAFISSPPGEKSQVRHKNGSKIFCHYTNLEWGSARENRDDTIRHGTSSTRGERNPKAKITDEIVREIRVAHRDIKEGRLDMKVKDLANKYGLHIATVCNIASGKAWRHVPNPTKQR